MQHGKVVTYASWQLKCHKKKYSIHNLELVVVVFALTLWWHYPYGAQFAIYIDYKSLQYFAIQSKLSMRQRGWMELLKDYDCEIS